MIRIIYLLFIFCFCFSAQAKDRQKESLFQMEKKMKAVFKQGSHGALLKSAAQVLAKNPKHLLALNYLGLSHLRRGKTGLARIIFEKALSYYPKDPRLHNNMGLIALKEGKKQAAVLAFRKSLDFERQYFPALLNLSSLYLEFYHYGEALPLLKKAYLTLNSNKKSQRAKDYVKIVNNYAVALTWAGDFERAEDIYKSLYKKDRVTTEGLINYAILLIHHLGDFDQALEILDQARFTAKSTRDQERVRKLKKQALTRKNLKRRK